MITLNINQELVMQMHRAHVKESLTSGHVFRFTSTVNGAVITLDPENVFITTLTNCYLIFCTHTGLKILDIKGRLDILNAAEEVIYTSDITFKDTTAA